MPPFLGLPGHWVRREHGDKAALYAASRADQILEEADAVGSAI
jgi:hypothetical protein